MIIDIVIKRSHLPNKKYDAVIDGPKTIPLELRECQTSLNIRMKKGNKDI